jgi:Ca-activated chloride channel family protein
MALRVYGHQSPVPPQNCNDTRLEVPFAKGNAPKIRQDSGISFPKGLPPLLIHLKREDLIFPRNATTAGTLSF